MRGQLGSLREQLNIIPRLEKKLEEQQKLLSSTSDSMVTLSRALGEDRDSTPKVSVVVLKTIENPN